MRIVKFEITEQEYERSVANGNILTKEDADKVVPIQHFCGYGIYSQIKTYRDVDTLKPMVTYEIGDSCD